MESAEFDTKIQTETHRFVVPGILSNSKWCSSVAGEI